MSLQLRTRLRYLNRLILNPSVDGCLTAAAAVHCSEREVNIEFVNPAAIGELPVKSWPKHSDVLLVNVAPPDDIQGAITFLDRLRGGQHELIGICDEHRDVEWERALRGAHYRIEDLFIKPKTRGKGFPSSGEVFLQALGTEADEHVRALCEAANWADRGCYEGLAGVAKKVIFSQAAEMERRKTLIRSLAKSLEPDQKLQEWMAAYDRLLVSHGAILDAAQDLGGGIYRISAGEIDIDSMYLLKNFPHADMRVLLIQRWYYRGAQRREILTVITDEAHLHLNDLFQSVRLGSEGRSRKVAVALNKEAEVLIMLRAALQVIPPAPSE